MLKRIFSDGKHTLKNFYIFNNQKIKYRETWNEIINQKPSSLQEIKTKSDEFIEHKKYFPGLLYVEYSLNNSNDFKTIKTMKESDKEIYNAIKENKLKMVNAVKDDYYFKTYSLIYTYNSIFDDNYKPKPLWPYVFLFIGIGLFLMWRRIHHTVYCKIYKFIYSNL
jgi:hypothetical protein